MIITGGAGIEGTSILATDFREEGKFLGLTDDEIQEASKLAKEVSVVEGAIILADNGATAMHDVTRGGIMETTMEIARLSGLSMEIDVDLVPSRPIVERFAQAFSFDPLKMISSGSLVCTMPPENTEITLHALDKAGIPAARAGEARKGNGILITREGQLSRETEIRCEEDELARMWTIHKER